MKMILLICANDEGTEENKLFDEAVELFKNLWENTQLKIRDCI